MLPIHTILCPTDFSEASYEALDSATELASHFHAELCLAHVVPPATPVSAAEPAYLLETAEVLSEQLRADSEQRLQAIIEHRIPTGVKARSVVGFGDAASGIAELAESENAQVIVISTHGLTGWRHLVFGSVAEKVVRLARRPVLVIPVSHQETRS